jgi:hypothetical protein
MYASIREYRTKDNAEVARRAQEGFIPVVKEVPGFAGYYMIDAGDKVFTITVAQDADGVQETVNRAREWVSENAADLIEGPPVVSNGEVVAQSS